MNKKALQIDIITNNIVQSKKFLQHTKEIKHHKSFFNTKKEKLFYLHQSPDLLHFSSTLVDLGVTHRGRKRHHSETWRLFRHEPLYPSSDCLPLESGRL